MTRGLGMPFGYMVAEGAGVSANREKLIDAAKNYSHILFIDQDIEYEQDALLSMVKADKLIIGCNYIDKYGTYYTSMSLDRENRVIQKDGIEQVFYTGFGYCLINTKLFDKVDKPYFLHTYENGQYTTEEKSFALKLADAGIPWYCDHEASKKICHIGFRKWR